MQTERGHCRDTEQPLLAFLLTFFGVSESDSEEARPDPTIDFVLCQHGAPKIRLVGVYNGRLGRLP